MTSRQLAFQLLQKAETNDQYLNIALDHALSASGLSDADKALTATLVYGVTERRITLDARINALSSRPTAELDLAVRTALRIGLYQLDFLDRIPPHAAVSETVSLVSRRASGFVNAVLRQATRTSPPPLPDRATDPVRRLSVAFSVGEPLCQRLINAYGYDRAESILSGFEKKESNRTTLSVNTLKLTREELASHVDDARPTSYAPNGLSVRGAIRDVYGFEKGTFFVQDEASQICVEALGACEGETVIDVCSCPGSKSFGSAIRMKNRGRILAFDLHAKKIPLIESGAHRLGITIIEAAARDGRDFLPNLEGIADRVLCDVPCSGFGVLSKKPELRYKDPNTSAELPAIQRAILDNACRYVKKGGTLLYSTCTLLPEENEENVKRFLNDHPEFVSTPFSVGALSAREGWLTLFPDVHGTDGFFVAKLTRRTES